MELIPQSEEDEGVDYQYSGLRLYYYHKARYSESVLPKQTIMIIRIWYDKMNEEIKEKSSY